MDEEWKAQEELKKYLNRILTLRPAKNLSTMSFFIFKVGKEILDAIGEDAGHIGARKKYLKHLYTLKLKRLPEEEAKVLDIVLEAVEWIKYDSTLWEWETHERKDGISQKLSGTEVLCTFDLAELTDEEIKDYQWPDVLTNLKSIGVELTDEIEDLKWHVPSEEELERMKETHNVVSPDFDVWQPLEKLAKEAGSDFFDYISDETLNDISDCCDFLDEDFTVYLKREKKLKEQVRAICPDTFNEKWKLLLKVYLQVDEESNLRRVSNEAIIELLPFISDIGWELDTIMVKMPVLEPKVLYLFANLRADDFGYKDGWYYGWYD